MKWARDFFAMARHAALELQAIDTRLTALADARNIKAQGYANGRVSLSDVQAASDAYLDFEKAADGLRAPHRAILDDATELLYGPHARAGVAKLLGAKYADVLCWRWLQLRNWREIARDFGRTVRWCQLVQAAAFDWLDDVGEAHIRAYNDGEQEFLDAMRGAGGEG